MSAVMYWNRLEPRPRENAIQQGLAAELRDPLWLLARQWQLGEFQGEDAGSPAFVSVATRERGVDAWSTGDRVEPYAGGGPVEPLLFQEPTDDADLALAVEIGLRFVEWLAVEDLGAEVARSFRAAFPLPAVDAATAPDVARFLRICGGRSLDGVMLLRAVGEPIRVPAGVALSAAVVPAVVRVLTRLATWVRGTYGVLGTSDPPGWRRERLTYEATLRVPDASGGAQSLTYHSDASGALEWSSFEVAAVGPRGSATPPTRRSTVPSHLRFSGMPNPRFWDFEPGGMRVGAIEAERRDLARLLLIDFVLIQGQNWFLVPLEQARGTFCAVEQVLVRDVFGDETLVPRADAGPTDARPPWTMFTLTSRATPRGIADGLFLPPSADDAMTIGPELERVEFRRDDVSKVVWAVEAVVPGPLGRPRERPAGAAADALAPAATGEALRYRIDTAAPRGWIPFVPVALDARSGQIVLERATLADAAAPTHGWILANAPVPVPQRLREEVVPRTGVKVVRASCAARWIDGSRHVWTMRRTAAHVHAASPGLEFDIAR